MSQHLGQMALVDVEHELVLLSKMVMRESYRCTDPAARVRRRQVDTEVRLHAVEVGGAAERSIERRALIAEGRELAEVQNRSSNAHGTAV